MHVSAILKGPLDQIGRRKVYIKITENNKRTFRATTIKIPPGNWKAGKVVGYLDTARLNEQIKSLILSYERGYEKPDQSFNTYAQQCLVKWQHTKRESTLEKLASKIKKFKGFFTGKLTGVDAKVLDGYTSYCFAKEHKPNTVWSDLKAVRVIIGQAIKEGLLKENPFNTFDMPRYRDPQKVYLTPAQVSEIEKLVESTTAKEYKICGSWFLIGCYCGLRYGDQKAFHKSNIKNGRLIIYTSKTGQPVSIKMYDKLKRLFENVDYKPMPYTNEFYNRVLKAIAAECGIKEKVSAHTARHTCATLLASAGVSIEVTAKILGHSSIRQTAIYYQITGGKIDSELEKIF